MSQRLKTPLWTARQYVHDAGFCKTKRGSMCSIGKYKKCSRVGGIGQVKIVNSKKIFYAEWPKLLSPLVPQVFYMNIEASVEIFRDNAIDAIFELVERSRNSHLDILAMAFATNGTLLGQWSVQREGILQLCDSSRPELAFQFGTFFRQKCRLRLDHLYKWSITNPWRESTIFFELYLRYENTHGQIMVIRLNDREKM